MLAYELALLFGIPAGIAIPIGVIFWHRRTTQVDTLLAVLMFSAAAWSLGYSLELASSTPPFFWLWGVMQYVGIVCAPLAFFLLMLHYAGIDRYVTKMHHGALWSIPALSVLFRVTDSWQGLIHRTTTLHQYGGMTYQVHEPGPWFWLQMAYSYLLLFSGLVILLYFRSTARVVHRRRMTLLALGSLAPFAGSLAYITGLRPLGFLDLTPLSFTLTGLAVAWGALGHRVLEVMPVARTALVDSFPDGLLMLDGHGRLFDMNDAAKQLLGVDKRLAIGQPAAKAMAQWPALVELCLLDGEGKVELEDRRRPEDVRYLEVRLTFIHRSAREASASLVVVTDITARKRVEEQLREGMKMEAVGQLAGGVAHDFNNLLQVINGNIELALNEIPPHHDAHPLLEEAAKGGSKAASLVRQLLAFGRRQVIRPEHLDLNEVVVSFLGMLNRLIGEHIRVEFVPAASLGTVFADRIQIEQALMNLSINARDAMPEGGMLRFETARVTPEGRPGTYITLAIADNGVGIERRNLKHIWEPFFTTKPPGKGTGLGLSTVYGIVQQHGGFAEVKSQPGEGTTFKLYFKEVDGPAAQLPIREAPDIKGGNETILLAEDDDTVRRLATRILQRAGYTVLTATDGRKALEVAREHEGRIDLAMLDVVMPEMGGRAAYDQLRQLYPQMKFLFVSGYNVETVNSAFVLDQGLELVQKPFERARLLGKVRELLER